VNIGVNAATLGASEATATGILNLNGGTFQANNIAKGSGTAYLQFAGGTLVANGNNTSFLQGLTRANIQGRYTSGGITYAGGAVFDTNGFNVTVGQNLLAPTGNGVAVDTFTPITGLIGAPYVQVVGTGTGATAQAIFDSATGTMTGITITNAGDRLHRHADIRDFRWRPLGQSNRQCDNLRQYLRRFTKTARAHFPSTAPTPIPVRRRSTLGRSRLALVARQAPSLPAVRSSTTPRWLSTAPTPSPKARISPP
jgi:hypothetical protein